MTKLNGCKAQTARHWPEAYFYATNNRQCDVINEYWCMVGVIVWVGEVKV